MNRNTPFSKYIKDAMVFISAILVVISNYINVIELSLIACFLMSTYYIISLVSNLRNQNKKGIIINSTVLLALFIIIYLYIQKILS